MYTCLKESEHLFCYRLQEVSNVVLGRKTFGILENWSLKVAEERWSQPRSQGLSPWEQGSQP